MGRYDNPVKSRYVMVTRKLFDAQLDGVARRRARDKEEARSDAAALLRRIETLEAAFTALDDLVRDVRDRKNW